jgi:hypothetical protein
MEAMAMLEAMEEAGLGGAMQDPAFAEMMMAMMGVGGGPGFGMGMGMGGMPMPMPMPFPGMGMGMGGPGFPAGPGFGFPPGGRGGGGRGRGQGNSRSDQKKKGTTHADAAKGATAKGPGAIPDPSSVPPGQAICQVCQCLIPAQGDGFEQHIRGKAHQKKLNEQQQDRRTAGADNAPKRSDNSTNAQAPPAMGRSEPRGPKKNVHVLCDMDFWFDDPQHHFRQDMERMGVQSTARIRGTNGSIATDLGLLLKQPRGPAAAGPAVPPSAGAPTIRIGPKAFPGACLFALPFNHPTPPALRSLCAKIREYIVEAGGVFVWIGDMPDETFKLIDESIPWVRSQYIRTTAEVTASGRSQLSESVRPLPSAVSAKSWWLSGVSPSERLYETTEQSESQSLVLDDDIEPGLAFVAVRKIGTKGGAFVFVGDVNLEPQTRQIIAAVILSFAQPV